MLRNNRFYSVFFMGLCCFIISIETQAATYFPDCSGSVGDTTSLYNYVQTALSTVEDDVINLGACVFDFFGLTPALVVDPDGDKSALPVIIPGGGKLSIINGTIQRDLSFGEATNPFRFLYIEAGADVYLSDISLINGNTVVVTNNDCVGGGAAIRNLGALSMLNTVLDYNGAQSNGGAICNDPSGIIDSIENSTLSFNSANGIGGGAIWNLGTINNIINSTLNNNAASDGGSIANYGGAIGIISGSTFYSDPTVQIVTQGGGIFNWGTINYVVNCTFYGHHVDSGGGIMNVTSAPFSAVINNVINSTFYGNVANSFAGGTGIYNSGTIFNLISDIIAGNSGPVAPDLANVYPGTIPNEGYNLFDANGVSGITPSSTDIVITSLSQLKLGPLQNNGGPTYTMALMPGSVAINNGKNPSNATYDQRGAPFRRVSQGGVDIGSFELQPVCPLFKK